MWRIRQSIRVGSIQINTVQNASIVQIGSSGVIRATAQSTQGPELPGAGAPAPLPSTGGPAPPTGPPATVTPASPEVWVTGGEGNGNGTAAQTSTGANGLAGPNEPGIAGQGDTAGGDGNDTG